MSKGIKIRKNSFWIGIIIIILIVSFLLFNNVSGESSSVISSENIGSEVGNIAPTFSIIDINNKETSLEDFRGKKVIIGFFATWCTPCQIEATRIKQIDDETNGNKFIVYQIGVDPKEDIQALQNFKSNFGNDDWFVGSSLDIAKQYNVKSLDTTIIIDEQGKILYRDNGIPASLKDLKKYLG